MTGSLRCSLKTLVFLDFYLGDVDICLLADDVGESSTNTLDGGHGEGDVTLTIDVGVLDTKDVLELVSATEGHFDSGPFLKTQK